ncbi:MAG: adaptor protein MecA [Clostridia bacterium]|nr:adaptor protein MecA [Clostridia bacterium]
MDMIAVNENKLKIILSPEDLKEFSLTTEELDYSRPETRLLLKCLLIRAKNEVGFDADGNRLLVQLYPSKHGGGEIYITKIGAICSCEDYNTYDSSVDELYEYSNISCDDLEEGEKNELDTLIRFESVNAMIGYSKRLMAAGYSGPSKAYYTEKNGSTVFFIYVCNHAEYTSKLSPSELAAEYGQKIISENKRKAILEDLSPIFSVFSRPSSSTLHILSQL